MKLNTKIHNLIRKKVVFTTSVQKTNLNTSALCRSRRALVLLPLRRCRCSLCSPRVLSGVREGVLWMAIASSDCRLGGGVAKEAPEPDRTGPSGRGLREFPKYFYNF
jgi:hypothetical protein